MGDDAPDPVALIVDAQDAYRDAAAAGRPPPLGIGVHRQSMPPSRDTNTPVVSTILTVPTYKLPTAYFFSAFS